MARKVTYEAVVRAMGRRPIPTDVIAERVGLKVDTVRRKLRWMAVLGLVRETPTQHGPAIWWQAIPRRNPVVEASIAGPERRLPLSEMSGFPAFFASESLTIDGADGTDCQLSRQSGFGDLTMTAATPDFPPPPAEDPALRQFRLSAFDIGDDGEEDVELVVDLPTRPSIRKHASLAGLYLLAIMTLDQDGTIADRIDQLLADTPINEVDCCNRIALLVQGDANTLAA